MANSPKKKKDEDPKYPAFKWLLTETDDDRIVERLVKRLHAIEQKGGFS